MGGPALRDKMGEPRPRTWIAWVVMAKALAIVLVVAGHFDPAPAPAYWTRLHDIVYLFHMPLFFLLSGYLYRHGAESYGALLKRKAKRLLYPFVSIAAIFFVVKWAAGRFVELSHPLNAGSLIALLTTPHISYMPLLWFIHALFLIFVLYPLARRLLGNAPLFALVVVVNSITGTGYPVLGNAMANLPFFIAGNMLQEKGAIFGVRPGGQPIRLVIPAAVFALAYALLHPVAVPPLLSHMVAVFFGLAGSLFLVNTSHALTHSEIGRSLPSDAAERPASFGVVKSALLAIGFHSMTIYLFHTLFESSVRIGLRHSSLPFLLVAAVAIAAGVIGPLFLERLVLRRYRLTRRFLLGIA